MTNLLHPGVSPSPGAYGASPFDAVEIDEHVDADRIWATILGVRDELERYENEANEKVVAAREAEKDALDRANNGDDRYIDVDEAQAAFDAFVTGGYKRKDLDALKVALWKDT